MNNSCYCRLLRVGVDTAPRAAHSDTAAIVECDSSMEPYGTLLRSRIRDFRAGIDKAKKQAAGS